MAQKYLIAKTVTLIGGGGIAGILFWMSLYLAGPEALFAGVIVLITGLAWFTRDAHSIWALTEGSLIACLIAAQASVLLAAILKIVPVVLTRAL